jgi:pimeloyl-ACP methyl ester carboxylesterase
MRLTFPSTLPSLTAGLMEEGKEMEMDRLNVKALMIAAGVLWGMKDIAFRERELNRLADLFSNCKVVRYADASHFIQEEKGSELCPVIEDFLIRWP